MLIFRVISSIVHLLRAHSNRIHFSTGTRIGLVLGTSVAAADVVVVAMAFDLHLKVPDDLVH